MSLREINADLNVGRSNGLCGSIDSVDESGIRGWVLDLADSKRRFAVGAYIDDVLVGISGTHLERPDVGALVHKHLFCGFQILWNQSCLADLVRLAAGDELVMLRVAVDGDLGVIAWPIPLPAPDVRAWIEASEVQTDRFVASVEEVSIFRVSGFVLDKLSPQSPASVEIVIDDEVVDTVLCDREGSDAMRLAVGDVDCGFQWKVPATVRDGTSKRLAVRIAGAYSALPGSESQLYFARTGAKSGSTGIFVAGGPVWITGWVADNNTTEALPVELHIDGKKVASGLAGTFGADLVDNPRYPFASVHTRFSFATPTAVLDGWDHEIRIHVPAWGGKQPPGATIKWEHGRHFGNLEKCDATVVSGWIAFRDEPRPEMLARPVEVYVDGNLFANCFLRTPRADVVASSKCRQALAFRMTFPGGVQGEVSVRYAGVELRHSPRSVAAEPRLRGSVDGFERHLISGWAVDLERPAEEQKLALYVDGELNVQFQTHQMRADVSSVLGVKVLKPGFAIPTPGALLDGSDHRVEVRALANGQVLSAQAATVRFERNYRKLPAHDSHPVLSEFIVADRVEPVHSQAVPLVSIIVLNRNGAEILDAMFKSFRAVNSLAQYEFIVVDHASSDDSLSILDKWVTAGVSLKVLPLAFNGSFSASNNRAIREHARGDYVLLLNNDIVFVQDILPELVRTLVEAPHVGVVGIKLLDVVEDRGINLYPPIQHLGIRYRCFGRNGVLPYDENLSINSASDAFRPIRPAGVTGAVMLMRRAEYLAIGGLEEAYFYGFEDVDLCLKYRVLNRQEIICRNDLQAIHHRGYSRLSGRELAVFEQLDGNRLTLMRRWGHALNRYYRDSLVSGDRVYTSERLRIAFAVTEDGPDAVAGDYFTALELARAIAADGFAEPVFLSERNNWYDLDDIHVLIVMRHDYDLRSMSSKRPDLLTVAWMRNHFEGWLHQRWFNQFDLYLSASSRFAEHLDQLGYRGEFFPIATNAEFMAGGVPVDELAAAVGFNGSSWDVERPVTGILESVSAYAPVTIVGRGWERSPVAVLHKGCLPYDRMPGFYASVDIVIDDANPSAQHWGSANSRIFDSLAAGKLVITNSKAVSEDLFGGLLPVWNTPEEAGALVREYLGDAQRRNDLVARLRQVVTASHTYGHRASRMRGILRDAAAGHLRIAIKCPVPTKAEAGWWGDWHFACGLQKALKRLGHSVRIDLLGDWVLPRPTDDAVIVLRGLSAYKPEPNHLNILWLLSHPDVVSVGELARYDHVYVASAKYTEYLQRQGVDAEVLLQCADPDQMRPVEVDPEKQHSHLFVANSRGVRRKIVTDLLELGVDMSIFGRGWHGLVPDPMIKGEVISNGDLAAYYSSAGVVLNDHWPDMARWGFISNRIFDAAACGAYVVSDAVEDLDKVFGGLVSVYRSRDELAALTSAPGVERWSRDSAERLRSIAVSEHTFMHRARVIVNRLLQMSAARRAGPTILTPAGGNG
jgi:GT2 family glycosyltransferase/spore maturation protein CgeB